MAAYHVRGAGLDDTHAISALAQGQVGVWQRLDESGTVQDVAYADLTVYERWLHGGPWMSVETGALQLSRLLLGAGLPLVVFNGEALVGYVEVYQGTEPQPYGRHLHIGQLTTAPDDDAARDALFEAVFEQGRAHRFVRMTANCAANDDATIAFYQRHGMSQVDEVRRMAVSAKQGQVFYRATEHGNADASQVDGWFLNIGRLGSSRYQWETLWPRTWDALPQIRERGAHRLKFTAAGDEAFVLVRGQLYRPRYADLFCWTPKPPSGQLITAVRDWAHREGYRKLVMSTVTSSIKTLGLDAEPDGYREGIYAVDLTDRKGE